MNDNVAIVVDFQVQGAGAGVINAHLQLITQASEKAARDSSRSFNQHFGANFFADLGARIVASFKNSLSGIVSAAIDASQKSEAALRGLSATASNLGISPADAQAAVQNLQIVKDGLISVGDASASLKNLLATGFGLPEAIDIIKAFGDTAAFGRQSALTYGEAIRSATEGIKNQNSILVDNAGLTKNLSVILKERGFVIQDLSDETKKQAALEALHNGLLKEANIQRGDANKLLQTYQGQTIAADAAQTRFLKSLGDTVTQSTLAKNGLQAYAAVLDFLAKHQTLVLGLVTAVTLLTGAVVVYNATAIAASIPLLASFVKGLKDVVFWMINFRVAVTETQTAVAATGGWVALIALLATLVITIAQVASAEEQLVDISQTRIDSIIKERAALEGQNARLNELAQQTNLTKEQQADLTKQYRALNIESQSRVGNINDEANAARKLQGEIQHLIRLRTEELELIARVTTAQLIGKIQELRESEARADALRKRIADLAELENRLRNTPFGGQGLTDQEAQRFGIESQSAIGRQGQLNALHNLNQQAQRDAVNLAEANSKLREEADALSTKQVALAGALKTTSDGLVDQGAKFGNVTGNVQRGKDLINQYRAEQEALNPAVNNTASALDNLRASFASLADEIEKRQKSRTKGIQDFLTVVVDEAEKAGETAAQARQRARNKLNENPEFAKDVQAEIQNKKNRAAIEEEIGLVEKRTRARHAELTELQQLQKQVRELEKDLIGFKNLSSQEFTLRFRKEELDRQKKDLEKILDLRRELGQPLNTPLPQELREALGADDVKAARLAKELADILQRQLDRKNAIKKITEEQIDAEEELARATIALQIPVVDAFTRAQLKYVQNIRERENLEKELTAEIALEIRKREDAEKDAARNIQQAQAEAFRDRLRGENEARANLIAAVARAQALGVDLDNPNETGLRGNRIIAEAQDASGALSRNPVVRAVAEGNKLLEKIEANTSYLNPQKAAQASAETSTGGVSVGAGGKSADQVILTPEQQAAARRGEPVILTQMQANVYNRVNNGLRGMIDNVNQERAQAEAQGQQAARDLNRKVEFNRQVIAVAGLRPDQMTAEQLIATTNEINRQTERRTNLLQEQANIEIESRERNLNLAKQQLIGEDMLAERRELEIAGVIDLARAQAELNRLRDPNSMAYRLELQRAEIDNTKELAAQERELIRLRSQSARGYLNDPQFLLRAQNNAEINRLRAAEQRANQIIELEDKVARVGEDAADRYRIAWLQAIYDVRDADIKAVEEQIAAVVKLSDATTLHIEQVRAAVAKHLASQKTVTETTADAIIKIYDRIAERADSVIDRTFKKLGFVGEIVGDFAKTYFRQFLGGIFSRVLGLPDPSQAGANGQISAHSTRQMNVQAQTVIIQGGGLGIPTGAGGGIPAGGGGWLGNLLRIFTGGGGAGTGTGGTPPFVPSGNFTTLIHEIGHSLGGGSGTTTPAAQSGSGGIFERLFGQGGSLRQLFGQNLGNGKFGGIFAQGSFGFGNSAFASMLPALGLSIGGAIGGGSGLGGALGMAGGLLAGIGLVAPAAVGLSGAALGGAVGALFSNPITAAVGAALLIGSFFIGRSQKRREQERVRAQLIGDARAQMRTLIQQVSTDQLDGQSALAQAAQIRTNYLQAASQLTDKKTRDIAMRTVQEIDYDIQQLQRAVEQQQGRQALLQKMIPTFDEGGRFNLPKGIPRGTQMAGYRYGLVGNKLTFGGVDEYVGLFREGEAFLTAENILALGGAPAMRRAGVRGFDTGGGTGRINGGATTAPAFASAGRPIMVVPVIVASEDAADALVAASNEDVIAQKVIMHVMAHGENGLAGVIGVELSRPR